MNYDKIFRCKILVFFATILGSVKVSSRANLCIPNRPRPILAERRGLLGLEITKHHETLIPNSRYYKHEIASYLAKTGVMLSLRVTKSSF